MVKFYQSITNSEPQVVMLIDGIKCKLSIDVEYDEYSAMPMSAQLSIAKTDEPLSTSDNKSYYFKWGGYPVFVQSECSPMSEDGRLYKYICTINNSWGDMGNANIFALLSPSEEGFTVEDVFVEASCS